MPKPTAAAKIAVSAAALATSAALASVKKYGAAQKAKMTTRSSQSTRMPQLRRKISTLTPVPPLVSIAGKARVSLVTPPRAVVPGDVVSCC